MDLNGVRENQAEEKSSLDVLLLMISKPSAVYCVGCNAKKRTYERERQMKYFQCPL